MENRGDQEDRVTVSVQGIDPSWVEVPAEFVVIPARQTKSIPFAIITAAPARHALPAASGCASTLSRSATPTPAMGATASLAVGGFVAFEADMNPTEVRAAGPHAS
ncbi:MAG: hypothetical protein V9E96_10470 [Chitinophagaceae bacterium]